MALQNVQLSALITASRTGDIIPLQTLEIDVNTYEEKGGFFLMRFVGAAPFTTKHVTELPHLIDWLGANVNLAHKQTGKTALHTAAYVANLDAVRILIIKGANIDAEDNDRSTPLTYSASSAGNARVVEYLLDQGASIDHMAAGQTTALHFAVQENRVENARVLLARGADKTIKDSNRRIPLKYAKTTEMKSLFKKSMDELRADIERQNTDRMAILLGKGNLSSRSPRK